MRLVKKLLKSVLVLLVVVVAVGFLLPEKVTVERSILINAPPDKIFAFISDLRNFPSWSPWAAIDPNTKYTFEGPDRGVGQRMKWTSANQNVGSGSQRITDMTQDEDVKIALDLDTMGTANVTYTLTPDESGTQFTWGFVADVGANPFMRWIGLMFNRWVGNDFERGLASLKEILEKQPSG